MVSRRAFLATAGVLAAQPLRTRLLCGGDVMLSRTVARRARQHADPAWPFREIAPFFAAADIAFANLESPFSDRGPAPTANMVFKAEPDMIEGLTLAGIDVVSTANNHARDRSSYGLEFTLRHLAAHGIAAVGTGLTEQATHAGAVVERHGTRFGFLAYTYDANNGNYRDIEPRIAVLDEVALRKDLAALPADVRIVSMHAGFEYAPMPNRQQVRFAKAAIDAGAQVVVGHHPHVRQPWERYNGGVIFYSLGNLVFDQMQRTETQIGSMAEVVFEGPTLVDATLRTVRIVNTVPRLMEETRPAFGVR
jgi:poly-gamma-glutamate synthesis protein (capsule biosynthesis protein)